MQKWYALKDTLRTKKLFRVSCGERILTQRNVHLGNDYDKTLYGSQYDVATKVDDTDSEYRKYLKAHPILDDASKLLEPFLLTSSDLVKSNIGL